MKTDRHDIHVTLWGDVARPPSAYSREFGKGDYLYSHLLKGILGVLQAQELGKSQLVRGLSMARGTTHGRLLTIFSKEGGVQI